MKNDPNNAAGRPSLAEVSVSREELRRLVRLALQTHYDSEHDSAQEHIDRLLDSWSRTIAPAGTPVRVTPWDAAAQLEGQFRTLPWYLSVAIGGPSGSEALFVYVKNPKHPELERLKGSWAGYSVLARTL